MKSSGPDRTPVDARAAALRERTLDLLADASVHVQRLGEAADRLGLSSDLVDGLGDDLYEAAIAQLDVASRLAGRWQAIASRMLAAGILGPMGPTGGEASSLVRIDVAPGEAAHLRFAVKNPTPRSATVQVDAGWNGPDGLRARVGLPELPPGRETSVEIATPPGLAGRVHAGVVLVWLVEESGQRIELAHRDFEIWVKDEGE